MLAIRSRAPRRTQTGSRERRSASCGVVLSLAVAGLCALLASCDDCGAGCGDTVNIELEPRFDGPVHWTISTPDGYSISVACEVGFESYYEVQCSEEGIRYRPEPSVTTALVTAEAADGSWRASAELEPEVVGRSDGCNPCPIRQFTLRR